MAQQQGKALTKQLRKFFDNNVQIDEGERSWARLMINAYVADDIYKYCNTSALPILRFEYTGSLYERLKTKRADEADIMIILRVGRDDISSIQEVPGYYRLRAAKGSPLANAKYVDKDGYILPGKLKSWFLGQVTKAVNEVRKSTPGSGVTLKVIEHGPAIQLDITEGSRKLSIDLVPAFSYSPDDKYLVAKSLPERSSFKPSCDRRMLWRLSYSVKEKNILANMDDRGGCRHMLLRIVKTVIAQDPGTFGQLTSYHLKTAFLRYRDSLLSDVGDPWHRDQLGNRYMGFLEFLQSAMESKVLRHYWVEEINLLEVIDDVTLGRMEYRLRRFHNSEKERLAVLATD